MENDLIVVLVTVGSPDEGRHLGRRLVHDRLAACVNVVGPVRSIYHWKDEIHDDEEWQLLIKTRQALFADVSTAIRQAHSYENPEIVALPVTAAAPAYATWVRESTRGDG